MNHLLLSRNPGLGRLMAAQIPSDFADWLAFVAVASVLAYDFQAPPVAFACLGLAMGLPAIFVGPVAGVFVDRWHLRPVLFWSNLGRGLVVLTFGLVDSWPALIGLVALAATIDAFFTPAKQSALQVLVQPDDRLAANSLSQMINQTSKIIGPALGGTILVLVGPLPVFALTAFASVVAAALLVTISLGQRAPDPGSRTGIRAEIGAGLQLVRQPGMLRSAIGLLATGFFAIFLYDTLIAPLMGSFGLGPEVLGLCIAANGLGGVVGALAGARLMQRGHPFAWVAAAMAFGGLGTGVLGSLAMSGALPPGWVIVAMFGGVGLVGAGSIIPLRAVIQNETPIGAMGRVSALTEAASACALMVAPLIGAGLATLGGIGLPFTAGAAVLLMIAIVALRLVPPAP